MPRHSGDSDYSREPCPDRIPEDVGMGFCMGCIGGFLWHFAKGAYNSPVGERLHGGWYSSRLRAPLLGGSFATWAGTYSIFDCSYMWLRGTEDVWNQIAAGASAGGVLALRSGMRVAARSAAMGGAILAIIELVINLQQRGWVKTPRQQYVDEMSAMQREKERQERERANPPVWKNWMGTAWQSPSGLAAASSGSSSSSGEMLQG